MRLTFHSLSCLLLQVLYLLLSCSADHISLGPTPERLPKATNIWPETWLHWWAVSQKKILGSPYPGQKLGAIFGRPRHCHDDNIDQEFLGVLNDEDMSNTGSRSVPSEDCHIQSLVCHAWLAQIAERISRKVYSIKLVSLHTKHNASIILIPDHPRVSHLSLFSGSITWVEIDSPSIPQRCQL